jgi:hypothetical protein
MLKHNPFAHIGRIVTPRVASPVRLVERPPVVAPSNVIEVPFVRLGLLPRTADRRSTRKEIEAVRMQETRRGVRRCVL